jgi:hypothetical protein
LETPVEGELSHIDMDSNYGGLIPTLVLDMEEYTVQNTGKMLVVDIDDIFTYTQTYDLLIEFRFDDLIAGGESIYFQEDEGGYRAYNNVGFNGNDTGGPDLFIDSLYNTESTIYSGPPLVNGTWYYWRVRTCDSLGIWSPWETSSFKYEVLTSLPAWSNLVQPSSATELGDSITIMVDVTHISGIVQVMIEFDSMNHTMFHEYGTTYEYTWVPSSVGEIPWTIYMEAFTGTWNILSYASSVEDTTPPTWFTAPYDKVLYVGQSLSIQFDATDLSGIMSWSVNDTTHFQITDGLLENATSLESGGYPLTITATDGEGNNLTGSCIVAVLELPTTTSTTTTTTTSTTTTTTSTTTTTTTTTTSTQLPPIDISTMIIIALVGVIFVLVIVILIQSRKS